MQGIEHIVDVRGVTSVASEQVNNKGHAEIMRFDRGKRFDA